MNSQKKSQTVALIPARYESSRFPGKPLIKICGKTLIQHTYENTTRCEDIDETIVATDDERIFDHVRSFGGHVLMTPKTCPTGSDRLAYVLEHEPHLQKMEVIVNVQGDEPCLDPSVITQLIQAFKKEPSVLMSTAVVKLEEEQANDRAEVKCVLGLDGNVLYFSRALIPGGHHLQYSTNVPYYKHIGIYAYRPDFLLKYTKLPMTPLQLAEDLEQLKVLEHGHKIKAVVVKSGSIGVNTPEDIKKVELELCRQNLFS